MFKLIVTLVILTSLGATPILEAQRTTLTHTNASIGVTSTLALAANKNRNFLLLTNSSDADIYCKFGATAVVQEGFFIRSAGGGLLLDDKFSIQALNCIHGATGSKTLEVTEGVQ